LQNKKKILNIPLQLFYEMVTECLHSEAGQVIQEWARCTSAGRLTGRDHFPHRNLPTQMKVKANFSELVEHVQKLASTKQESRS
jgi:hypothetical protein